MSIGGAPLEGEPALLADSFLQELRVALEHFVEPGWLGAHSPLATPYFLGERLAPYADAETAARRGELLRVLLVEATVAIAHSERHGLAPGVPPLRSGPAGGRDDQDRAYVKGLLDYLATTDVHGPYPEQPLLYWNYLSPAGSREAVAYKLGVGRATYARWLDKGRLATAIARLGASVLRLIRPSLRLELPAPPEVLVGRDGLVAACVEALAGGQPVGLAGPSGAGKTALGATVAARLAPRPVFWFTFMPGLNDRPGSLLFELGYFLHRHGASSLWLELVARQGTLGPDDALRLLSYDLARCAPPPILCFDEVDLLAVGEAPEHGALLDLLERLIGKAPLLLIGQQIPLDLGRPAIRLGALAPADAAALLAAWGVALPEGDLLRLHAYTGGNPGLLRLFSILLGTGEPLHEALRGLPAQPSAAGLLARIGARLSEEERTLLAALSVFRRPVPRDALERDGVGWRRQTLGRLIARQLLQPAGDGAVMLLPALRLTLYEQLPPPGRATLHLYAAQVRAARGEVTAAAWHYLAAGRPALAVNSCYLHSAQEINQGQAETALALLGAVREDELPEGGTRERWRLLLAQLRRLAGDNRGAQALLRKQIWRTPQLKLLAQRLEGDIAYLSGELDAAIEAYEGGLATIHQLLRGERALLHTGLARVYLYRRDQQRGDLQKAWRASLQARFEVEEMQGEILHELHRYAEARRFYDQALALARELGHIYGEAKVHNHLALLLSIVGQFQEAVAHAEQACLLFERIGVATSIASAKINLALAYNLAGQPDQAIAAAAQALTMFTQLEEPYGAAAAAQNLAEAHLARDDLDLAEGYARRVVADPGGASFPDGLRVLGEILAARGDLAGAAARLDAAVQECAAREDRYLEAYARRSRAGVCARLGMAEAALADLEAASELFRELALPAELARTEALMRARELERGA